MVSIRLTFARWSRAAAMLLLSLAPHSAAQTRGPATLEGAISPRAKQATDRGALDPGTRLSNLTLVVERRPEQRRALEQLLAEQQDPASPNFRKWLTPEQFGERFGASAGELGRISDWLRGEGFAVEATPRGRGWVIFSGTAGQIANTFSSRLHRYDWNGKAHFAPSSAPRVPAEFAGRIAAIRGLDDFYPEPMARPRPLANLTDGSHALAPGDISRIYNIDERFFGFPAGGWNLAVIGNSAVDLGDIQYFQTEFQLPANVPQMVLVGDDPGVDPGGQLEADFDLEWAGAVARKAGLIYVYGKSLFDAAQYAVDQNLAQVLSFSFGLCEANLSADDARAVRDLAQQANAQGITWVAASGDAGAATCDAASHTATHGLSVSFPASLPEVTAIGGTEFQEGQGFYWSLSNAPDRSSATQYIPETAWNDSSPDAGIMASGGGRSVLFPKPAWQTGPGVPEDGARDVPDLALAASPKHDPYLVYSGGKYYAGGGTSLAAPLFAAVLTLTGQGIAASGGGSAGFGNINPSLYVWATDSFFRPLMFHDITTGNNIVPCSTGTPDCDSGSLGYSAGPGFDLVTGLGSLQFYIFLNQFRPATTTTLTVSPAQAAEGAPVVLTATVRDLNGKVPAGRIDFLDSNLSQPIPTATLDAQGTATVKVSLFGGPHSITARYTAPGLYRGSTSAPASVFVIPAVPPAPIPLSPPNGATNIPVSTQLVWQQSTSYATYDVYLGTSPAPPFWGNVDGTRASPSGLTPNTKYYWRIVATNVSGTTSSPVWSFITSADPVYTLSRIAGGGQQGFAGDGAAAPQALLNGPSDLIFDGAGNLYVADTGNHRVRRIGADGTISTVAGNGSITFSGDGGPAIAAGIYAPTGLAFDSQGNLYISDEWLSCVRVVSPDGNIATFAGKCGPLTGGNTGDGGPATEARLIDPVGLAVDAQDRLYIATMTCVRRVESGVISTVAGQCGVNVGASGDGGPATSAVMNYLKGIALDNAGNLYIADSSEIRKVADGVITRATIGVANWVAAGPSGELYWTSINTVREVDSKGTAALLAGGGGLPAADGLPAPSASLSVLGGIRLGPDGRVYFADAPGVMALNPRGTAVLPSISGGAWNTASGAPGKVAPGSIATLFGSFHLDRPAQPSGAAPPKTLAGLAVQFQSNGGVAAPLFYVSGGQVNLQIPWELAGQSAAANAILNGNAGPAAAIELAPFAPGIFTMNGQGTGQGAIVDTGYRLVDASNPTQAGNVIEIFCTGLGPVANPPATGAPASSATLSPTASAVSVTVGGVPARVLFSGLTPGTVGEYQVNVEVPAGVAAGPAVPVVISIGGVDSNTATIAVR